MKFSPKCRTKKLGMIHTIWGSFCSFFNREGAVIQPKVRPRKIPVPMVLYGLKYSYFISFLVSSIDNLCISVP